MRCSFRASAMVVVGTAAMAIAATPRPALAQSDPLPDVLPPACETGLALSAAPPHLRADAGVYNLQQDGYQLVREAANGFTCIVNRDDPRVLKPVCFDAEGTASVIPKILRFGEMMMGGDSVAEVNASITAAFEAGELVSPARPGVAYMLSRHNRPYDFNGNRLAWFPPHIMFYAPNLTNEDIGVAGQRGVMQQGLPFIGYQGPQGFMIVAVAEQQWPAPEDLSACPSWVSEGRPEVAAR